MNENIGSNFDDFLKSEDLFDNAEAFAIKRLLADQSLCNTYNGMYNDIVPSEEEFPC